MAEYRGSINGNQTLPAKDLTVATGQTIVKGDLVTLDATGKLVKAGAASANLLGVSDGANPQTEYEKANGIVVHKVRPSKDQVIEVDYTGGTPVVGTAYAINASQQINVADTTNPKTLKVVAIVRGKAHATVAISAI